MGQDTASRSPFLTWSSYQSPEGFRDECQQTDGTPRAHWTPFWQSLETIGRQGLQKREEKLRQVIQEHGVTFNVYGDPQGSYRPWTMDLLPVIIPSAEWEWLERALQQRVRLLNLILADCYGPRHLLATGLLPPEMLLANPLFLRPCVHLQPGEKPFIHIFAADLARSPDGRWWALANRIDSPSGIGYALENRILTRRVLQEPFQSAGVRPLQPFIDGFLASFEHLAPWTTDRPRVVYLTPGPANETYFEQSYLARNLGFPLVEGADLQVRDNRVWLKTLGGAQPVDAIIRRVDSLFADPLEFRADSLLGVPGLVQAVRHGRLALANALGVGLVEAPAFQAFLPYLCRHLLGEEMLLPSVATWWCGQERERAFVLENLSRLVIKPSFLRRSHAAVFGQDLSKSRLQELRDRILARPEAYCAQEAVNKSTTPALENHELTPRHFLLRAYAVGGKDSIQVMPGGLCRIASNNHPASVAMQQGGRSKDTWVLSGDGKAQAGDRPILLPASHATVIRRARTDVPSRMADNLFWFGRYVERADQLGRMLRLLVNILYEDAPGQISAISALWYHLRRQPAAVSSNGKPLRQARLLEKIIIENFYGVEGWYGLFDTLQFLHRSAFCIKERLSADAWQIISRLEEIARGKPERVLGELDERVYGQLNEILILLAALHGLSHENMTRGQGWYFLDLGKRIERSQSLILVIGNCLEEELAEPLLYQLIVWADSLLTYRRRYLAQIQVVAVLDLILLDGTNPRSLVFQCDQLVRLLSTLPQPAEERLSPLPLSRQIKSALVEISLQELNGGKDQAVHLQNRLWSILGLFWELSDTLTQVYFSQVAPLAASTREEAP